MTKEQNPIDRNFYKNAILDETLVFTDPFAQFSSWFRDAGSAGVDEPEAMFLATVGENGIPSGRVVLLRVFDSRGFVFFSNYRSRKGREIENNPFVAITFHWKEIERQVRITGKVHKISPEESDAYFISRPLDSRISAMASDQSSVITGRKYLVERFEEIKLRFAGKEPERPSHWGGFNIVPSTFEFWQARLHRLHDRIRYRYLNNAWVIERLSP